MPAGFLVANWTPQLLKMLGFSVKETLTAMTIIGIGVPLGCFLNSLVADKGGRKMPLAILFVFAAITAFITSAAYEDPDHVDHCRLYGHDLQHGGSFLLFSYTAESYPTRMRNTATGFHNGLARLSVSGSQFFIPMIHAPATGSPGIFTLVAFLFFLPVIPLLIWGQRTGGQAWRISSNTRRIQAHPSQGSRNQVPAPCIPPAGALLFPLPPLFGFLFQADGSTVPALSTAGLAPAR